MSLAGKKSAQGNEPGAGQGASSVRKVWPRYVWLREDEGEEPFESPHRAGRELCQGRPQGPAFLCPDCGWQVMPSGKITSGQRNTCRTRGQ